MLAHRRAEESRSISTATARPRVSEGSAADNPGTGKAPLRRPTKRALASVEESLGELRQLIAKTAAAVYAVDDLLEKILWDDRTDERDEERRNERLSLLIGSTRETAVAAVEMGEELSGELFRLRTARRGAKP